MNKVPTPEQADRMITIETARKAYAACWSINKDNPLAVAENLGETVEILRVIAKPILTDPYFPLKGSVNDRVLKLLARIDKEPEDE